MCMVIYLFHAHTFFSGAPPAGPEPAAPAPAPEAPAAAT